MRAMLRSAIFQRFWSVAGAVNIRTKVLGIVLGLVLLLGFTVTLQVRNALTRSFDEQLQDRGVSVTRDLAARATDLILVNDLYALHQLLQETLTNNRDVRYVFILDPQGQVLAHTFGAGFPRGLLTANTVDAAAHHHAVWLSTDEGRIWDIAVPIFDGRAGVARVGLSEAGMRHAVNAVTGQLLLTTVFVSAIGIAAATALTWILTRPIISLVQAAEAVAQGDFSRRLTRWANDEIGDLAEAFNAMTASLARAARERAERDQLRAQYVSGVIAAQEEERKRIARELHDGTGQLLTSLLLGLRAIEDAIDHAEVRQRAGELREMVSHTLAEVRNLALQLRPSALDDLGLSDALEHYIADCCRHYGLHIEFTAHGLDEQRLPSAVETALYRMVQEALTNVARHAQAQVASVLLERRGDEIVLIVEDNGRGFDPDAVSKREQRLGLYGIRERAELLGGRMVIESAPGQGTSLFVTIPLDGQASAPERSPLSVSQEA
ncbi:MAG: HAMP domain-containing protein [Anaerolineae bacterium]